MRKKPTKKQEVLLKILPNEERNSIELTLYEKLVLAQVIQLHGSEYSDEHGKVYIGTETMMKNTGIRSDHTITKVVGNLKLKGYFTVIKGGIIDNKRKATEYILTDKGRGVLNRVKGMCSVKALPIEYLVNALIKKVSELEKRVFELENNLINE